LASTCDGIDETLPNFRKETPKKGRENETRGKGPKSRQANRPTKAGHKEEMNSMVYFFLPWSQYKAIEFSIYDTNFGQIENIFSSPALTPSALGADFNFCTNRNA
jgi:hypothetical protein